MNNKDTTSAVAAILFLLLLTGAAGNAQAQEVSSGNIDSVFSMSGKFKRSDINPGTDSFVDFRVEGDFRNKISENVRTIEKIKVSKTTVYRISSVNIPADSRNVTRVEALIDYDNLHLISIRLSSRSDSGYVEFNRNHFTGWSLLPKQERKSIDFQYKGLPLPDNTYAPWIPGLLLRDMERPVALPYFALFQSAVNWRVYSVLGKEEVIIHDNSYDCWKINAGASGPPGYTAYQWYDKKGRLIKSELQKEGVSLKFVSELKSSTNSDD